MDKQDLDFIHGKREHQESAKPQSTEMQLNLNLLEASAADIDKLEIKKVETEKSSPFVDFEEIDGKDRNSKAALIAKAKELEELLGIKDANPYGTLNKDIFAENLGTMSVAKMTELATRIGIQPSGSRSELKKRLLQSFDFYARKHNVTVASPARPIQLDKNAPNYEESVKLFEL